MKIGRTLPPTAAPLPWSNLLRTLSFGSARAGLFEEELRKHYGVRHCFLLSSGKASLAVILSALHAINPDRDEVIIPAFTCFSVPASIKRAGLKIRLCDMAPSSLDYDMQQLAAMIADDRSRGRILAVTGTHFFGCPADIKEIGRRAGTGIAVIEDAAQAMGEAGNRGRKLGTLADIGFFSLGRGKALSLMEGGIIVTDRDDLAARIIKILENVPDYSRLQTLTLSLKAMAVNLLQSPTIYWLPRSLPFLHLGETLYENDFDLRRMSVVQRKLARNWAAILDLKRKARKKNIIFWQQQLPERFRLACAADEDCSLIRLPVFAQTPEERERILLLSASQGLGIMPVYPTPINEIAEIREEFGRQSFPRAKSLCRHLLTLPVHELVTDKDNEKTARLLSTL